MINLRYTLSQIELYNAYHCVIIDRHSYIVGKRCEKELCHYEINGFYYKEVKSGDMTPDKWISKVTKYLSENKKDIQVNI